MAETRSKPTKERFTTYLPPEIAEWITRGADREARSESQQIAYKLQKQHRREQAETPERRG
jgi:hypothetical protein